MTGPTQGQAADQAGPAEAARPGPSLPNGDGVAGWSAGELATLASIAETFVRGGAVRRARLAALAIESLDPAQVRQLRLVLRLVESRLVNLAIAGRPTAFRDLLPDARARYLLGWGTSRFALRRSGYQAFKKLLCFLAYADPGETGANPLWTTIGYRSPIEPLTEEPTPIVPLAMPASAAPVTLEADVVIVGSGAGGGVVAAEAARAGRSVVVVEAGPFIPESEMPTDELTAYDRMYLDHGMTATWDGSVSILAGAVVGGGTTVNWMTSIPVQPAIRAEWAAADGIDGIDAVEFNDDLAAIEREIGVQAPPNVPAKDAAILRGAAALGWEAAETQRDGVACGDCGSCSFGCRRGAKQGGLRVHLADAWRNGARIVPGARVGRVLISGGRATGVEARLADGRSLTIHAPQVVLAAGALRTPGILERSGVGHPAIGRFLRLHPVSVIGAFMRDDVTMWSGTTQAARSLEWLEPRTAHGSGFVIESAPGHPGLIGLAFPWESTAGFLEIMNRVRQIAPLIAIVRDTGAGGRVRSTGSGGVRIDYRMGPVEVATLRRGLVELARLGRAAGARDLVALGTPPAWYRPSGGPDAQDRAFAGFVERLASFDFAPNRGMVFSAHQMGTARMGTDPRDHAVDPRGRVRSDERGSVVPGLYVGDGSLFPTAIGVNPMITIMVLARRVARTVVAEA